MKFLDRFTKKSDAALLVQEGLAPEHQVSFRQIRNCLHLLAATLGDGWKNASKESVAGMALVVLTKNVELAGSLNKKGWSLVLCFVTANPEIAKDISPRTLGEIFAHQADARLPLAAI